MNINKLDSMPWILNVGCIAAIGIGILQLSSLFYPSVAPGIDGKALTSPLLIVFMGLFYTSIGIGILRATKLVMPAIILIPFIRYAASYLDHGSPETEAFQLQIIFSLIWAIFFACYLFLTKAKLYFQVKGV